jgi:ATP-dependent 26S proteasome regulatory subunit
MCKDTITRIDTMIRSRVPVIAVTTHEEARVVAEIEDLIRVQNAKRTDNGIDPKAVKSWSIARGIVDLIPGIPGTEDPQPIQDPTAAILQAGGLTNVPNNGPTVWIFKDIHPYFKTAPQVVRALRDAAAALEESNSTIILVSPNLDLPEDLKKTVRVVDFPLPTKSELLEQVNTFVDMLPSGIKVDYDEGALVRALQGLTRKEADQALAQAAITNGCLNDRAIEFVLEAKAQIIRESGALEYYREKAGYNDIGGLDLLKAWAREAEKAATPEAQAFGVEAPSGALLVGVPGCGKSLTAKAIAGSSRPLLRLDVGALFGSLVGQSEAQTRNALKVAEAVAPCVLWIDEIEKGLASGGGEVNGGTSDRVLGTILTWMEESQGEVFLVATANDIGALRPELVRRFDETFFVDLPTPAERDQILSIHMSKRGLNPGEFDLSNLDDATEGFTGAELEKVVKGGIRRAFFQEHDVTLEDFLAVANETVPLSETMSEGIQAMRQWAQRARPASSAQETGNQQAKPDSRLEFIG